MSYDTYIELPLTSSRDWVCPTCKKSNLECLPDPPEGSPTPAASSFEPLARSSSSQLQQPEPHADLIDHSLKVLDAATATTVVDPPPQIQPDPSLLSPNIIAPKPMRPIDAAAIVIPASPLPQSSPLPPAPSLPAEQPPTRTSSTRVDPQSRTQTPTPERARMMTGSPPRPPILLDTAICVLLVLVFALICRRIL